METVLFKGTILCPKIFMQHTWTTKILTYLLSIKEVQLKQLLCCRTISKNSMREIPLYMKIDVGLNTYIIYSIEYVISIYHQKVYANFVPGSRFSHFYLFFQLYRDNFVCNVLCYQAPYFCLTNIVPHMYICLANGSKNICVLGHLQINCSDVSLCPMTVARTVINFHFK